MQEHNQKNVVLLHGMWPERINGELIADIPLCNPNNEGNWMGLTEKQLEESGIDVTCPFIPDSWGSKYEQWKVELDQANINENTVLVGLSVGAYAILRYLGESKKKVKKVILVAPGGIVKKDDIEGMFPNAVEFTSFPIAPELKTQIKDRVVIFISDDEPYDGVRRATKMYEDTLDAKVIRQENMGHYSFLISEFPELLDEIVN